MALTVIAQPARRLNGCHLGIAGSAPQPALPTGPHRSLRWLGCHGGAGVSTLLALTGLGHDAGGCWPAASYGASVPVVLVCRATGWGTVKAMTAVQQWRDGAGLGHVRLLGLVVVAASPKAPPNLVAQRLQVIGGWLEHLWRVAWHEDYVAADNPTTVGPAPDLISLRSELVCLLRDSRAA